MITSTEPGNPNIALAQIAFAQIAARPVQLAALCIFGRLGVEPHERMVSCSIVRCFVSADVSRLLRVVPVSLSPLAEHAFSGEGCPHRIHRVR